MILDDHDQMFLEQTEMMIRRLDDEHPIVAAAFVGRLIGVLMEHEQSERFEVGGTADETAAENLIRDMDFYAVAMQGPNAKKLHGLVHQFFGSGDPTEGHQF